MKINLFSLDKPVVMGILNITPDSFFDGGQHIIEKNILNHCDKMVTEGAEIIDIGAVSSRPGSIMVNESEEAERLLPALKSVRKEFPSIAISIDTFRSNIAKQAAELGADIINDISAGNMDEKMFETIASLGLPYIMMHMQGTPDNMQNKPTYEDLIEEIRLYFLRKIQKLESLGFNKIIIDPGFGFGKTLEHNYELLDKLKAFSQFGYPLLVGVSRKSMIQKVLDLPAQDCLNGTTVINTIALTKGANILRVHDVREAREAVRLINFYTEVNNY
jgi:dihydropteroate synthase